MDRNEFLEELIKEGVRCKCGGIPVDCDTWFNWYPCENHKHLNPRDYSMLPDVKKNIQNG